MQRLDAGLSHLQGCEMGIILSEFRTGSADIGQKLIGMAAVQIPNGRREHQNVAGRLVVGEDELSHRQSTGMAARPLRLRNVEAIQPHSSRQRN